MRDLWRRIGTPDAISWVTVAVFYPMTLVFSLYGSKVPVEDGVGLLVLASLIASTCTVAWLGLARLLVFGFRPPQPPPVRTIPVLLSFAVALLVRAVVMDRSLMLFGLSDSPHLGYRLISSIPGTGCGLLVLAILVSVGREYRRNLGRLDLLQREFEELEASLPELVETERSRVIELARVGLDERLRDLSREAPPAALERVRTAIEEVVRPLSRQLGEIRVPALSAVEPDTPSYGWGAVARGVFESNPVRPLTYTLWLGGAALLTAPMLWGPVKGLQHAALVTALTLLLCSLAALVWKRWAAGLSRGYQAAVYSAMALVCGAVVGCSSALLLHSTASRAVVLIPMLTAVAVLAGWMFAALFSLLDRCAELRVRLRLVESALHRERVRLNALIRAETRALARTLHGPVQDALSVAGFRIRAALDSSAPSEQLLTEVQLSVESALARMPDADREASDAPDVLAQLVELWEGVADVEWTLSPEAQAVLSAHTVTRSSFNELVREACSNAVSHGEAERVEISGRTVDDELELAVFNTGRPVAEDAAPGFGTGLLDELALWWRRRPLGDGTELVVRLPLVA